MHVIRAKVAEDSIIHITSSLGEMEANEAERGGRGVFRAAAISDEEMAAWKYALIVRG